LSQKRVVGQQLRLGWSQKRHAYHWSKMEEGVLEGDLHPLASNKHGEDSSELVNNGLVVTIAISSTLRW
jgi:hypothetical protein